MVLASVELDRSTSHCRSTTELYAAWVTNFRWAALNISLCCALGGIATHMARSDDTMHIVASLRQGEGDQRSIRHLCKKP